MPPDAFPSRKYSCATTRIEKLNGPFPFGDKGTPAEYSAGLKLAIERGWREIHDSGTFVKFTADGADLFA